MESAIIKKVKPTNGKMTRLPFEELAMKEDGIKPDHIIGYVYKTYDYSKFKFLAANRELITNHVKVIKNSSLEKQLILPICVNELFEIIDGQHRFQAWCDAELPIYYYIVTGYRLAECIRANYIMRKWSWDDMLDAMCKEGEKSYLQYKEFKEKYGFNHGICLALLLNISTEKTGHRTYKEMFFSGNLIIKNHVKACEVAEKIKSLQPLTELAYQNYFVFALLRIFKIEDYNHEQMIKRIEKNKSLLHTCASITQYQEMLHIVYNYHSNSKNKLELRSIK